MQQGTNEYIHSPTPEESHIPNGLSDYLVTPVEEASYVKTPLILEDQQPAEEFKAVCAIDEKDFTWAPVSEGAFGAVYKATYRGRKEDEKAKAFSRYLGTDNSLIVKVSKKSDDYTFIREGNMGPYISPGQDFASGVGAIATFGDTTKAVILMSEVKCNDKGVKNAQKVFDHKNWGKPDMPANFGKKIDVFAVLFLSHTNHIHDALHKQGIVQFDNHTKNFFIKTITETGIELKLGDFGTAHFIGEPRNGRIPANALISPVDCLMGEEQIMGVMVDRYQHRILILEVLCLAAGMALQEVVFYEPGETTHEFLFRHKADVDTASGESQALRRFVDNLEQKLRPEKDAKLIAVLKSYKEYLVTDEVEKFARTLDSTLTFEERDAKIEEKERELCLKAQLKYVAAALQQSLENCDLTKEVGRKQLKTELGMLLKIELPAAVEADCKRLSELAAKSKLSKRDCEKIASIAISFGAGPIRIENLESSLESPVQGAAKKAASFCFWKKEKPASLGPRSGSGFSSFPLGFFASGSNRNACGQATKVVERQDSAAPSAPASMVGR